MFENSFRRLSTRDIAYTEERMESLCIHKIFNSTGVPDSLTFDFIYNYYQNCCGRTRHGLIDIADKGDILRKVSIIVFEDVWSRNIYALTNWDYFNDSFEILELYN